MNPVRFALAAILVCSTSYAGPVLLATMNAGVGVGTPRANDWHWPVLFFLDGFLVAPNTILFDEIVLDPVYPVTVTDSISRTDDPQFDTFASYITDGVDQSIISGAWNRTSGLLGGGGGPESHEIIIMVPHSGPDLSGYTLDHITRSVMIDLESPGSDPMDDGLWTDWTVSGRYEFYGTAIPEPGSLALLLSGTVTFLVARRRSGFENTKTKQMAADPNHGRKMMDLSPRMITIVLSIALALSSSPRFALAQCETGGSFTRSGLAGLDSNDHPFQNRCLAASGANVTITIEAMADLGCNAWDGTHNPRVGSQCPTSCTPICCDTSPTAKYVTATANGNSLSPSIAGSTNMPNSGRFFEQWNGDCNTDAQVCLEAGRSPCDPNTPSPNKRIVTIPAATWNSWLGSSGSTMTVTVMTSAAVTSASNEENSLALYCQNLGFNLCPFQSCSGLCGPSTFSRVTIAYSPACNPPNCNDNNPCTNDACSGGTCTNSNNTNSCSDGVYCNGADSCSGGSCSIHAGSPCGAQLCCESTDSCAAQCCTAAVCNDDNPCTNDGCSAGVCTHAPRLNGAFCLDSLFCNGSETCQNGACSAGTNPCTKPTSPVCNEATNACDACPAAQIDSAASIPITATIDARQPNGVDELIPRQGIGAPMTLSLTDPDRIRIQLSSQPPGAETKACWALCETLSYPESANSIAGVTHQGAGVYAIELSRAITAGAVTTIQYQGASTNVEYVTHPANANANSTSNSIDIIALIDYLNGVETPVYGIYSTDMNHSGLLAASDITRLIDLLNGAGVFDTWLDSELPVNTICGGGAAVASPGADGAELSLVDDDFVGAIVRFFTGHNPTDEGEERSAQSAVKSLTDWSRLWLPGVDRARLVLLLVDAALISNEFMKSLAVDMAASLVID